MEREMTKSQHVERDRRICDRKRSGESSAAIGSDFGLTETRINQIYNVSQQKCHYWRNLASNNNTDRLKIIKLIEGLPLADQQDIHRLLERRAPI
jgi:hypothetical protein